MMLSLALIPLLPLLSACLIFFFGRWLPWRGVWLGLLAVGYGLVRSVWLLVQYWQGKLFLPQEFPLNWFRVGIYQMEWGILLDGLSVIMLVVVTLVSFLVQLYSLGYMQGNPRLKRYYAYLSLFTTAMLTLVAANNYLQLFMGWELVGVCSYLLIGFEFEREAAAAAGNKAFLTTKLGDLGLTIALLWLFTSLGTFNMRQIEQHVGAGMLAPAAALPIALLLFCGAAGKSAQFPLHVWLPDAMEGPTPVSALIHAATMVAAGVYLVARSYVIFSFVPVSLDVVAWVGGLTACFAATMAVVADDIKRVLAFSTISQLGYMMLALGMGGYTEGMFHLATHACFKALLFLGAGAVIHAVHTNSLWAMGGLRRKLPITAATFLAGALALAGVWPLAGFYSKDAILSVVYQRGATVLFLLGTITAFLTAFYMTRVCLVALLGAPRDPARFANAHEAPKTMTIPLVTLAVLAVIVGKLGVMGDSFYQVVHWGEAAGHHHDWLVPLISLAVALGGILLGWGVYGWSPQAAPLLAKRLAPIYQMLSHGYWVDDLYEMVVLRPVRQLAVGLAWADDHVLDHIGVDGVGWVTQQLARLKAWMDDTLVDGLVDCWGAAVTRGGAGLRRLQTGMVQHYLMVMSLGLAAMALWRFLKGV